MSKTPAQQISSLLLTRRSQGLLKICNKLLGGKSFPPEYPPSYSGPEQQQVRVVYLPAPDFGPNSVKIVCSPCQATVNTTTSSKPSMMAWAVSCVLCFTMLWPCFCVPFCVDSLKNVKHTCPNCKSTLGRYKGGL